MHRRKLLGLLATYQERYPEENECVERFYNLIQSHSNCFDRTCWAGHITGSCWLVDPTQQHLLLTHHRKLEMWIQLGGHSDGDPDTPAVALREAQEESGLSVALLSPQIFDLDIHQIPARKQDPAHYHYDVRFALLAQSADFVVSHESLDLAWVNIEEIHGKTDESSILRMREKWRAQQLNA